MIQVRRNVFETNSSSSHSITLSTKQLCTDRTLLLDDEGYVTLYVNGFCSNDAYVEPVDKLGYVLQVYAAKNKIYLNHAGGSEKFTTALQELYGTEEFKNLEYRIKEIIGPDCKGIRFDENCGWGYIDDSYEAVDEFCTYSYYDPIDFIFNDYCLHYSYNGYGEEQMIQIRRNVFETNSSSTHSITMCMKSDYDLWVKDKVWFVDRWDALFLPWDELIEYITKKQHVDIDDIETIKRDYADGYIERVEDMLADYDIYTYSSWMDKKRPELERFKDEFTTPGGETICSFGYFGDDY